MLKLFVCLNQNVVNHQENLLHSVLSMERLNLLDVDVNLSPAEYRLFAACILQGYIQGVVNVQSVMAGLILWVIIFGINLKYAFKLKKEISYLPSTSYSRFNKHPLIGINIKEILHIRQFKDKPFFILILSSTCPPCHQILEEVVHRSDHKKFPLICYVSSYKQEKFNKIATKYSSVISLFPIESTDLNKLNINLFPTFLVVNKKGIVKNVTHQYILNSKNLPK